MKLLIDTNVILDMVFGRNGCETSMELFRRIREIGAAAYVTASSVTDLFYIIRKETHDTEKAYAVLENIFKLVSVFAVSKKDIESTLKEKWKDFEDCVQYMTGKNNEADYIITVNRKDYKEDSLPVLTPASWMEKMAGLEKE